MITANRLFFLWPICQEYAFDISPTFQKCVSKYYPRNLFSFVQGEIYDTCLFHYHALSEFAPSENISVVIA